MGPTSYGDSPYQSFSTFAGNPYFIDLEVLIKDGLLTKEEVESVDWGGHESYVDFEKIYESRSKILRKAYDRYDLERDEEYGIFVRENGFWLEDYCLYMAIKDEQGGTSWIQWPQELRNRHPAALQECREKLEDAIGFECFIEKFCSYVHHRDCNFSFSFFF